MLLLKENNYNNSPRKIEVALKKIRSRILRVHLRRTVLQAFILGLAACIGFIAVEKIVYLPALGRIGMLVGTAVALVCFLFYSIWRMGQAYGSLFKIARLVDRRFPEFKNRLEASLQFILHPHDHGIYSKELVQAAVDQAAQLVDSSSTIRSLADRILEKDTKRLRFEEYLASAMVILSLLLWNMDPFGTYRILENYSHPLDLLRKERAFRIFVHPGNVTILRGDSLQIKAVSSIYRPEEMMIHFWQTGKGQKKATMPYVADQFEYSYTFPRIENDISYFLAQGDTYTDTFQIQVISNPFVTELRLRYEYPPYTHLPPFETTRDKSIQGLRGTRVIISGRASNPLAEAHLVFAPDSLRPMKSTGERDFIDTLVLEADGSYRIRLKD
ncbi:MAG: hypothetical protein DRG82_14375, partial [Deltaproteobacteria bacterium]